LGVPFFQVGILVSGSPSNLAWLSIGILVEVARQLGVGFVRLRHEQGEALYF
jgi:hypothetical protein